ncbi:MAG: PLDc N-terminal domain-containing protein [Verrucomicrobia bacterium]|nr:PLDc N-terminal domain-containing protein [Verrucomicrobiota bacterium]
MLETIRNLPERFFTRGLLVEAVAVAGFVLAVLLVARLMSERRAPANTLAWLLGIVLVPWIGVPLYLVFGGRKLRRLARKKTPVHPLVPGANLPHGHSLNRPVAQTIIASGAPPPVGGNTLQLLTDGQETWAALESHIRAARHSIHLTTFILGRDDTGRRLVKLLAARAREGVKVRLLLDSVGCMFLSRAFLRRLTRAGGEVAWFMPVFHLASRGSANLRSHRKIAVFDHCTAIAGGHNLAREYMGPTPWRKRWRDFSAVVTGPAAVELNEVFIADWCFTTGQPPESVRGAFDAAAVCAPRGNAELQVVASGPDVPGDPLYEGILTMIQEARHSLCIVTPYFIPDEVLMRSLIVKARAGRRVTVLVPAKPDHLITELARRHSLRELAAAGADVRLVGPGMMHSKALLVDDRLALFGSANFDPRSLFVNFEIGVFVHSHPDVLAMKAWTENLHAHSHAFRPERKRRYVPFRNLAEEVSRLLAPLL